MSSQANWLEHMAAGRSNDGLVVNLLSGHRLRGRPINKEQVSVRTNLFSQSIDRAVDQLAPMAKIITLGDWPGDRPRGHFWPSFALTTNFCWVSIIGFLVEFLQPIFHKLLKRISISFMNQF